MDTVQQALKLANKLRTGYVPIQLLSENSKTCISINMPIASTCYPTKRCSRDCYGRSGHIAWENSLRKQRYIANYLEQGDIDLLINECRQYVSVRLNGVGDLNAEHVPAILSLAEACPQTTFWGMTRKIPIAEEVLTGNLPNLSLLLSVDVTSPASVWEYQTGPLCFGPRRPEDDVPDDQRIITVFPRHHAGKIIGDIPLHAKDCPAVRHKVDGCLQCKRCWNWHTK